MMTAEQFARVGEQFAAINRAARQAAFGAQKMIRPIKRIRDSRGDRHVESVVQSIMRGEPGYTTSDPVIRLIAASDFGQVLDRMDRS